MVKFWKEDFKYIKRSRYILFFLEGFGYRYTFSVRGESANYLINKYNLLYPNVKICVNHGHEARTLYVMSETESMNIYDIHEVIDGEDAVELAHLLEEEIVADLINYEEYRCGDWYKKDSRWE